jgi:putative ABC transport system ATP-binding protein
MLIELRKVYKTYQMGDVQVNALNGLTLDIDKGELTAIMGPSGSGKSTLMNIIGCLDQVTSGDYILDGVNVSSLNDDQLAAIRNRKIGFVFQSYNLLPRTTAVDNVEVPLIYAGAKNRRQKAIAALEMVGLGDRIYHRPNELSGGQQQRVAIARALINDPDIILADEPTGNLDTKTGLEIVGLFQRLNLERGITVIYVTHSAETAECTRRVIQLRDGILLSDEKVANPRLAPGILVHEPAHSRAAQREPAIETQPVVAF